MTVAPRKFDSFEATFATAFAEEISGETFLAALGETEPDPRRAALWAKIALIEARTVVALRPLATKLGLTPTDEAAVRRSGREEATEWQAMPFADVMAIVVRDYRTGYLAEFEAMLPIAPPAAIRSVQRLIDHEVAIIDMARAELSGASDPTAPLDAYLSARPDWTNGASDG